MAYTHPIDERLRLLSHIAYPAWLKQLDLTSRIDMVSMQSHLARTVSSFLDPAIINGMIGILSGSARASSLLSGIVDTLPAYAAMRALHDVNADSLLSQFGRANEVLTAMIPSSLAGVERIDWAAILAQPRSMHDLLQAMPKEGLRNSFLAEAMLSRFDLSGLASRLVGASAPAQPFTAAHVGLLSAYTALSDASWWSSERGDQPGRVVLEYPSRALLLHADVAEQVSVVEPSEALASEREGHVAYISHSEDHALPELLYAVDPGLPSLLAGAEGAVTDGDADWLRHFSISGRELTTHVLHALAPDDEVRAWTADPAHYHDGRPTRRARTDFILQKLGSAGATAFVDAVFRALLATHDLLQKGSHALSAEDLETLAPTLLGQLKVSLALLIRVSKMDG